MKASFKILHLEDVKADALLVERELRRHHLAFENRVVENRKDFLAAVKNYMPDVILADHTLPSFNSVEALKIVHQQGLNIPFILVTSPTSEEFAVDVIRQGADDYVLKNSLQRLPGAMLNAMKKRHYQREQKRLVAELKYQTEIARESLEKLSNRMILAAKAAHVGIWDWDIQQNYMDWDTTMYSLNGMNPDCFGGGFESWENCMHPDDIIRVREEMYNALEGVKEFDTEFRVLWEDKSIRYIKAIGIVQRDEDGTAVRMLGTNWDVTDRRKLEEELQRSEDFYRTLIESSTEIKFLAKSDGTIIYMGNSVSKILGFNPQQMLGRPYVDFIYPDDRPLLQKKIRTLLQKNGSNISLQLRCLNTRGKYRWFESNIVNLLDRSGINALVFTSWDITARKKAEFKLEEQHRELVKTNAELDSFVYSASHELRAPLCSLLGLINLMEEDETDAEKRQFLAMMQKSVQNLDTFINSIIQYSRNSRQQMESQLVNFSELIDESIEQLHYLHNASEIDIHTEIYDDEEFYSDKRRISIIINNLLSNAIAYHNVLQENPVINIKIWQYQDKALIEFSDNGKGIEHQYLDKIFQMFYRATSAKNGAGLGLYIVKEILDKLSGCIQVESKPGIGTTFTIEIPNARRSEVEPEYSGSARLNA